jgi:hypothetical protein
MIELNLRNFRWKNITNMKGDVPNFGRFGHSCNLYKNRLYFFGGEKDYNNHLRIRNLIGDIK